MEAIESRNLLSLSLSILEGVDGGGVAARIAGDEADDVIWAQYNWLTQQVTVNPDRECLLLDATITRILIDAGPGNDLVHVRGGGGAIQFSVDGGPGNDTLTGSNGHDWIEGGDGDDWITWGGRLWGGKGRDVLDLDVFDIVTLGEEMLGDLAAATPPQVVDPNKVVTPPCPPECPPGWEDAG